MPDRCATRPLAATLLVVVVAACGATSPEGPPVPGPSDAERLALPGPPPAAPALSIGVRGTIASNVLGEEREFLVYAPDSGAGSERSLPVLYLLDGEAHFHHVSGLVAFLEDAGRIPPIILVGLVNTERNRDLTPSREERIPGSGGAEDFVRFLETELTPEIDRRYGAHSFRILAGHSFGGLLVMHVLVERPEMFDAYFAISPTLEWDDGLVLRRAEDRWKAGRSLERFLYFTLGDEAEEITRANEAFAAYLKTSAPRGLVWSFERMEDEDHGSTPHRTVYNALNELFAGWRLPADMEESAAIEAHYGALSERFRLTARPSETALTELGYRLLGEDRDRQAVEIFSMNVAAYPESPNAYDCLGEALEKIGERERALENFELAVQHATSQQHRLLEVFIRNRDRLRVRLDESTQERE